MKRRNTAKPSKLLQGLMGIKKPTREEKYRAALAGDSLAVEWLHFDKPDKEDKLDLLLSMCRDGAHRPLVQTLLLELLFEHPRRIHAEVPGSREILAELTAYAAYEHHPDLPDPLILYRGTCGVPVEVAKAGYFWSPSADYAAKYAVSRAIQRGQEPLLIRALVPKSEVAVFFDPNASLRPAVLRPDDPLVPWEVILVNPPQNVCVQEIPNIDELRAQDAHHSELFAQFMANDHAMALRRAVKAIGKRMREVGYEP